MVDVLTGRVQLASPPPFCGQLHHARGRRRAGARAGDRVTAAYGTGPEFVPVPVDLGQALAFPGIYLEVARGPACGGARATGAPPGAHAPQGGRHRGCSGRCGPGRVRRDVPGTRARWHALAADASGPGAAGHPRRARPGSPLAARPRHPAPRRRNVTRRRCRTDRRSASTRPATPPRHTRAGSDSAARTAHGCGSPARPPRPRSRSGSHGTAGTRPSGLRPVDPTCEARIAGRHSVARSGVGGPVFGVVCVRDGSEFAWGVVSGGAR